MPETELDESFITGMHLAPSADGQAWEPVLELDVDPVPTYESLDVSFADDVKESLDRWEHDLLRNISEGSDPDFVSVCRNELLHVRKLQARHQQYFYIDGKRREGR